MDSERDRIRELIESSLEPDDEDGRRICDVALFQQAMRLGEAGLGVDALVEILFSFSWSPYSLLNAIAGGEKEIVAREHRLWICDSLDLHIERELLDLEALSPGASRKVHHYLAVARRAAVGAADPQEISSCRELLRSMEKDVEQKQKAVERALEAMEEGSGSVLDRDILDVASRLRAHSTIDEEGRLLNLLSECTGLEFFFDRLRSALGGWSEHSMPANALLKPRARRLIAELCHSADSDRDPASG